MSDIARVKSSFANFLYLVWRHLELPNPTPMQYEIAHYLQYGDRRCMVQAFRGIGKSWITAAFVLWLLLNDPQLKILVVSASQDRSEAFSAFVKRLIHDMPILAHLQPGEGQRDSVVKFDVGPARPAQAPSVKCVGITGQMTGSRADVIIADDVEVPKNSMTQLMRDRLAEAIKEFSAILTTNREKNRIIYLGTPQTEMSIYQVLPSRGFNVRTWTARVPEGEQRDRLSVTLAPSILKMKKSGAPTDTRFTDDDLAEREAEYGRSGFALQFMLDTNLSDADRYPLKLSDLIVHDIDVDQAPVRMVWGSGPDQVVDNLNALGLTGDRYHRPIKVADDWTDYTGSVMFIDPSGRGADETSFAVVKYCYGTLYLTRVGGFKDGYGPTTLDALARVAKTEKVNLCIVEPNYGGGMFNELFKPVLQDVYSACKVDEAPWSKGQKELRIIDTLEPVMNQHRLVVSPKVIEDDYRAAQTDSSSLQYSVFYQMTRITKERGALAHDDRIEAVAGAVYYWVERMAKDTRKVEQEHKDKLLDKELKTFKKHALRTHTLPNSGRPKPKSLLRTRR